MSGKIGVLFCALLFGYLVLCAQTQEVIWDSLVPFPIQAMDANTIGEVVVGGNTTPMYSYYGLCTYTINKYTSNGVLQWSRIVAGESMVGGSSILYVNNITIDDYGDVLFTCQNALRYVVNYSQYEYLQHGVTKLTFDGDLDYNIAADPNLSNAILETRDNLFSVTFLGPGTAFNFGSNWFPGTGTTGQYYVILLFDLSGEIQSYKFIRSNGTLIVNTIYMHDSDIYVRGGFTGTLFFDNHQNDGSVITYQLLDSNGTGFIAKLGNPSNNWLWQANCNNSIEATICIISESLFLAPLYGSVLYKYSCNTGSLVDSAAISELLFVKLTTTTDNSLHFDGLSTPNSNLWSYGLIDQSLNIVDITITSIGNWSWYNYDYRGNRYLGRHNNFNIFKYGYPSPYPVRLESLPITFSNCYPDVQYEQTTQLVNIGNSPLLVSDLQFINETTGLSAEVVSVTGDTLTIRFLYESSTISAFSDTLVVLSNSPYAPYIKIKVTGNVVAVPPQEPDNIGIILVENSVNLTWNAVTTTISGSPITPDYYFIYCSDEPNGRFLLLGITPNLAFTHHLIGLGAQYMFYKVSAVRIYRNDLSSLALDGYLERSVSPGMPEYEVRALLNAMDLQTPN